MTVLIVDDSEASRLLLGTLLASIGYESVLEAASARDAWDLLNGYPAGECPVQLILMDVIMPEVDGIEAIGWIKGAGHLQDIPIIAITANHDETTLERAFTVGAIDYINKPVKKVELRARMRSIMRLKAEMDQRKLRESELEGANNRLRQLSNTDGLLGIANRRFFDEALDREWRRAERARQPLSLLMMDVDWFKRFNDTYGHLLGDECLKRVAGAAGQVLQRPGDLLGRFGGEEFVILLPHTNPEQAEKVAAEIHRAVAALAVPHAGSEIAGQVTVSIGIAGLIPNRDGGPAELVAAADAALYAAKHGGRNRSCRSPGAMAGATTLQAVG